MTGTALIAALHRQARACAALGSPLTAQVLGCMAKGALPGSGPLAARLDGFTGDIGPNGASVPLRLTGGLHALVLVGAAPDLAALYRAPPPDDAALCAAVAAVLSSEADFLAEWIDSPPQTNEVRRSAIYIASGHWLAARYGLPMTVSELGASAGLNLAWDRYALDLSGATYGSVDPALRLAPDWRGALPPPAAPEVADRAGVDLNPLDPIADRLRVLAYVWPDQIDRLERTAAAMDATAELGLRIDRGDAATWLEHRLATLRPGRLHLICHTIAVQYFPPQTRDRCMDLIAKAGASATPDAPVAHLGMEADTTPGSAGLTLTLWPGGETLAIGRADFHARWIEWCAPALDRPD